MTADQLVEAFALPLSARVDRRIPKTTLIGRGAVTAADRRLIDRSIDRLNWVASLSPTSIGVAASSDPARPAPEIQLLTLFTKVEPVRRLLELVHRAIPYPLVLLVQTPSGVSRLSLAPLRPAERIVDQLIIEQHVVTPDLTAGDSAFLESLNFEIVPRLDLGLLYEGFIERAEAMIAARLSGRPFRLPADRGEAEARRDALTEHQATELAWIAAKGAARKEKRLNEQVRLSEQARRLKEELAAVAARLA
jgi:hypothetical protein